MADINVAHERPQAATGRNTWILALVAVLAIGGLMWYLAAESAKVQHTVAVESERGAGASAGETLSGEPTELAAIAAAPESFDGRELLVSDVAVAATLGDGAFWAEVPGANPFLVVLAPGVAPAAALAGGQHLTITGAVEPVNDAVLDEWIAAGSVRDAARDEASFATHYLRADAVAER